MTELERCIARTYTEACRLLLIAMREKPDGDHSKQIALCDAIHDTWPHIVKKLEDGMDRPF